MVQRSVHAIKAYEGSGGTAPLTLLGISGAPERVLTFLKGENISGDISSFLGCLNLEDGTDRLSRNVGKRLPTSQKNDILKLLFIIFC